MNDLPRVFANKIEKDINKSQDLFYGSDRVKKEDTVSIDRKINNIFRDKTHIYKSLVRITTNTGVEEKVIVGKTNKNLITINGELINIASILNIEKI